MGAKQSSIYFNIYGVTIEVSSSCTDLLERLQKDFFHFADDRGDEWESAQISLTAYLSQIPWEKFPSGPPHWTRKGVTTIDHQGERFNNYEDKLLSIYSFSQEKGVLYSQELHLLHEITYLLILSRCGKSLDRQGMHRIHAFGVQSSHMALLGIFPMGHGKSTSLLEILKLNQNWKWFGDDCLFVDRSGDLYSFPLRLGVSPQQIEEWHLTSESYQLKRRQWGLKHLVCAKDFPREVVSSPSSVPVILLAGRRKSGFGAKVYPCRKLVMMRELLVSMVIGVGLPIIFEYFWETGHKDFWVKTKIAVSRAIAAWRLFARAESYWIELSDDPQENIRLMEKLIS